MLQNEHMQWITLDYDLIKCQIKRIDDDCYLALSRHKLAFTECFDVWESYLSSSDNEELKTAPLAFFLMIFENAFGPSGSWYDRYKGAFSFPFALRLLRKDTVIPYLLHVSCWRGSVEVCFYKIIPADETRYDTSIIHKPFDDELAERQMQVLVNFLMGFAVGFWTGTRRNKDKWEKLFPEDKQQDFVKAIDSNCILFGCKDRRLFQMCYSDRDEYEQKKSELLMSYQHALHQKMVEDVFFKPGKVDSPTGNPPWL
ncbi:MAG: hypothetical protein Q8K19_03950 [Methylicorpusculum sp.]|uniref:hypothetical protein n=1 Tax=Methylicorpusculum sp. TaxID=2713644 RepID=UPI002731B953|nr:hypothetical protein [Methylicorpusculum sp.]MDP2177643.1 hypothetical protein [Methylicorpusculum sp.]